MLHISKKDTENHQISLAFFALWINTYSLLNWDKVIISISKRVNQNYSVIDWQQNIAASHLQSLKTRPQSLVQSQVFGFNLDREVLGNSKKLGHYQEFLVQSCDFGSHLGKERQMFHKFLHRFWIILQFPCSSLKR